ncbi:hypothetical protein IV203_001691 [Nitzschia inconspicua]|uniref:Trafficking protein particle complex subunit 11 domain-containing protein n=1 Tax=Nitzschia inconspicua TaxID=303405 RepID=A0A9K3L8Z9_9STRA|nr:hypothetical protein IV203_001691 [Nitzschia inconspicua]
MESYPGELLVGVFPLIFCVDATLHKENKELGGIQETGGGTGSKERRVSSSSIRSQFDRFLDAMAASLMEDLSTSMHMDHATESERARDSNNNNNNPMANLFRSPDDPEMDSDEEDEMIFRGDLNALAGVEETLSAGYFQDESRTRRTNHLPKINFPRIGPGGKRQRGRSKRNQKSKNPANDDDTRDPHVTIDAAFSAALQQGQSFFQRARIVPVSSRYGFPPSKDPTGQRNRINEYFDERYFSGNTKSSASSSDHQPLSISRLLSSLQKRPVDGILPSGWLEKHAAALPSVILIVLQVSTSADEQRQQDEALQKTVKNLHDSLAPKRLKNISIKVVGLLQEGVSKIAAEQWAESTAEKLATWEESREMDLACKLPPIEIALIDILELQPDSPYNGSSLQQLHGVVRDASMAYYSSQVKHVKSKLLRLGSARTLPALLPLAIRYSFKAAIFYEFLWKQEKSLKYMVEAYLLLESYYSYLVQRERGKSHGELSDQQKQQQWEGTKSLIDELPEISTSHSNINENAGEGVELSLTYGSSKSSQNAEDDLKCLYSLGPAPDMIYQCRYIADWMNFKILQSGLVSNSEGGLVAASTQWQRHVQAFCCPRRSLLDDPKLLWLDWAFIARQHIVLGQLLERYPPRFPVAPELPLIDEASVRFASWRSYASAAEALIRMGCYEKPTKETLTQEKVNEFRPRYVGGVDHDGYGPMLDMQSKKNNLEEGLKYVLKGISSFNRSFPNGSECDQHPLVAFRRAEARLQCIAGGILLGLSRCLEALPYLESAADLSKGWSGMELAVSRLLIECSRRIEVDSTDRVSATALSHILRACFVASGSDNQFQANVNHFSQLFGGDNILFIQWSELENEDTNSPLSFNIYYPGVTHGTAGDAVNATIWLKSKVNYALQVDSITIFSFSGQIVIPKDDLLHAKNASEGSNKSFVIQAHAEIEIRTKLKLPEDLSRLSDDGDDHGSSLINPDRNLFLKSARPRVCGITAGAGCCFTPDETELEETESSHPSKTRKHNHCGLGGKPLRCAGLKMTISPIRSSAKIELRLERVTRPPDPATKRTPFEADNYVSSAWERPEGVPLNLGPRCLRILPPMPKMRVTDITFPFTKGVALEGTVNRFVLMLEADHSEDCIDLKVQTAYSSKTLGLGMDTPMKRDLLNDDIPLERKPVLVKYDGTSFPSPSSCGCYLPPGWSAVQCSGSGGEGTSDGYEYAKVSSYIGRNSSVFVFFDLYRPISDPSENGTEHEQCETHICVSMTYRQGRVSLQPQSHSRPKMQLVSENESVGDDRVSLDYKRSIVWKQPFSSAFANHHANSSVPGKISVENQSFSSNCRLGPSTDVESLAVKIEKVSLNRPRLDDSIDDTSSIDEEILFSRDLGGDDLVVCKESGISLAWPADQRSSEIISKESGTVKSGTLSVYWRPVPLKLPTNVVTEDCSEFASFHGPLQLQSPSVYHLDVPAPFLEQSPFEVTTATAPGHLKVSVPFELLYRVENKTAMDQDLEIHQQHLLNSESLNRDTVLFDGPASSTISLAPFESYSVSFMMVPTKVGRLKLPHVSVWSKRYRTWVVKDDPELYFDCLVMP